MLDVFSWCNIKSECLGWIQEIKQTSKFILLLSCFQIRVQATTYVGHLSYFPMYPETREFSTQYCSKAMSLGHDSVGSACVPCLCLLKDTLFLLKTMKCSHTWGHLFFTCGWLDPIWFSWDEGNWSQIGSNSSLVMGHVLLFAQEKKLSWQQSGKQNTQTVENLGEILNYCCRDQQTYSAACLFWCQVLSLLDFCKAFMYPCNVRQFSIEHIEL